jgi:hypothetical protein
MSDTTPTAGSTGPDDGQTGPSVGTDPADTQEHPEAVPAPGDRSSQPPAEPPPAPAPPGRPQRPVWLVVALGIALAAIAALVAVLVWPSGEEGVVTETTTTLAPSTTATTEPSTTLATPTTAPATTAVPPPMPPPDTSTAVFPSASSTVRFNDPVQAARAFAVDFVGFTNPLVGGFKQGDARSGEVDVRPTADGPVTTVFVRQLTPGQSWWVLGASTDNIATDAPGPGDTISSPVTVSGSAVAFEGVVNVEIRQDGTRQPLGTGNVIGGGDILRPFSGQITFSRPSADNGAVVFLTRSEQDGRVWEATVIRVRFS